VKFRVTMHMDPTPVFPANDMPAARENIFHLLHRLELALLEDKCLVHTREAPKELLQAALEATDKDLVTVRQLLTSLNVELVET